MINFSIIIPHYNLPDLLKRCLNSIPNRKDIQVIVIDDNSSPNVVDFTEFPGVSNCNIEVILDKIGGGAGHARNIGLEHAKGKWILFVDSDDFLNHNAFDELDKYKDSDADIIMFRIKSVVSETLDLIEREGSKWNQYIEAHSLGYIETRMMPFYNLAPWGKMISSKLIKDNNICFDNIICAEDIMFSTKIACSALRVVISENQLYVVTHRNDSLTNSIRNDKKKFLCKLDAQVRRNKYLKKHGFKQSFLTYYLHEALKINKDTFYEALVLLFRNKMLTTGLWQFIKYEYYTKIIKKNYYLI